MLNTGEKELVRTGDPLLFVRYLDIVVVLMAAPFVVALEAPLVGYAVGAAAWILNRAIGVWVEHLAERQGDVRRAVGLNLTALFARAWLVGLTILAVGLAGEREDGLTAAVLMLVAFTLYFVTSLLLRSLEGKASRP